MTTVNDKNDSQKYWLEQTEQDEDTRAGKKLRDAVEKFGFDFADKVVLDIGSSTGGFTKLALNNGAIKVIAVEKGTKQMQEPLRSDPRVDLHEKTDIFTVDKYLLGDVDVVLADVSFVSLRKVLTYVRREIADQNETDWLVMLKPQFEAYPDQLLRGVVKSEKIRRDIIKQFETWLKSRGFVIVNKHDNDILGKRGNTERFYWLRLSKRFSKQNDARDREDLWLNQ